jgi:hypothetical protein
MTSVFNYTISRNETANADVDGESQSFPQLNDTTTTTLAPEENWNTYDDDLNMIQILNISNVTHSPPPSLPSSLYTDSQSRPPTSVGVLILAILLVVLSVLLTILVLHILRYRLMRRLWLLRREQQQQYTSNNGRLSAAEKDERYSLIEEWLISKRVLPHDDACQRLLDATTAAGTRETSALQHSNSTQEHSSSLEAAVSKEAPDATSFEEGISLSTDPSRDVASTAENDDQGCPICMSPFEAGEIVSCSADEQCTHLCT